MIASTALLTTPVVTAASTAVSVAPAAAAVAPATSSIPRPSDRLANVAIRISQSTSYGGQCKAFVQKVHNRAGRGWLGLGYYSAYPNAGYVRIPGRIATRGDIVQFYWDSWSTRRGIHTAILTGETRGGGAPVIDSNYVAYERIGRHWLNVAGRLSSYPGLKVAFWRYRG